MPEHNTKPGNGKTFLCQKHIIEDSSQKSNRYLSMKGDDNIVDKTQKFSEHNYTFSNEMTKLFPLWKVLLTRLHV